MPTLEGHTCFFCDANPATRLYRPEPPLAWPEPIDPRSVLAMCDSCSRLPAREIARHLAEFVNAVRAAHNSAALRARAELN